MILVKNKPLALHYTHRSSEIAMSGLASRESYLQ